jgi:alkylation response protein AidB-like acyl-CoA dehydrogenase
VNFDFSDEQQALRDQARKLFADGRVRARRMMETGQPFDRHLWRDAIALGCTGAAIAEDLGGVGLGPLELCVIAEEAGRTLAPIPFASSVLHASEAIKLGGGDAAETWLPQLAEGNVIGTVAFAEGAGSWDRMPKASVEHGCLTGAKQPVADPCADIAVVSARAPEDGDGFGWFVVDLRQQTVRSETLPALDAVRRHGSLHFASAPAARLGAPGAGAALSERLMDAAAIYTAFEQIGGADAQLARCVEYAGTRRAFGAQIGSFQGVKHRLADMYVKIELARGHALYGAWALSTEARELKLAAAGARLSATDAFSFAAEEAIELHGGIGFTWEDDCHLYYRRARSLAMILGNPARWSQRLVQALAARARGIPGKEHEDGF